MKRTVTAAILMSLIASSVAMADTAKSRDRGPKERWYSQQSRDDRGDDRRDDWRDARRDERRYDHRYRDDDRRHRDYDRRDQRGGRYWAGEYRRPWGYRSHHWRRGERLPAAYYARPYVVKDYRRCHLRQPPRGAHWVRVNQDVVLAAIATGIVLDVVYNRFY